MINDVKKLKTPLRYPGGKSRATKKLEVYLPDMRNYDNFHEPFLGGGSVSLYISKKYPHLKIWVNDLYEDLYNFWIHLQSSGDILSEEIMKLKVDHPNRETAKELFFESKEILNSSTDKLERAIRFWVLNKCSFSGLTESSSFSGSSSETNFSTRGINNLKEYQKIIKDWKFTNQSYETLLKGDEKTFVYLDPPYDIKDVLYGKKGNMHKGFDHDLFSKYCNESSSDQLISYNSDQWVKERFPENVWKHEDFHLTYTMRSTGSYMENQKKRMELVMFNYAPFSATLDPFLK